MSTQVKYPVIVIAAFVWIGFVCAISFMEAWLKFRAPGLTLPVGLQIGKLVFSALNKVELLLAAAILISHFIYRARLMTLTNLFCVVPMVVLFLQTIWLLPALSDRATMIIEGMNVPSSNLHFYYVFLEGVKVISLFMYGMKQFKQVIS